MLKCPECDAREYYGILKSVAMNEECEDITLNQIVCKNCDYVFSIEIDRGQEPDLLKVLIDQQRTILEGISLALERIKDIEYTLRVQSSQLAGSQDDMKRFIKGLEWDIR